MSGLLEATAVRVGMRVMLYPAGQPIPEDAVVYGPAKAARVYETFYEATHCPHGHLRAEYERRYRRSDGNGRMGSACRACAPGAEKAAEWSWGAPALA